jgi:hypothetical protein
MMSWMTGGLSDRTAAHRPVDERTFLLQRVQPGLSGLLDDSPSTLASIVAAVAATHRPLTAFSNGLATG